MGAMQNNAQKGQGNSSSRGSVNNAGRLQAFAEARGTGQADWGGCDPQWIQAVLVAITAMGGAATFGLSKDGGAHSLTLLLDGTRETLWFNGGANLDEELENVVATLDTLQ